MFEKLSRYCVVYTETEGKLLNISVFKPADMALSSLKEELRFLKKIGRYGSWRIDEQLTIGPEIGT